MSRYQMYWQVYFHPVTRSAEVILRKIFKRAKELYHSGYSFRLNPSHFYSFFDGKGNMDDYLRLDESIVFYYFQGWQDEEDQILCDLCERFINRRLFKYVEFDPNKRMLDWPKLQTLFRQAGIDPDYYLVTDYSSDLPYDFYRPGEDEERLPIHLIMPDGKLRELSRESDVVEAISGKNRTDHKLFYPYDLLADEGEHGEVKQKIRRLLQI